jgi:hypothetical protein
MAQAGRKGVLSECRSTLEGKVAAVARLRTIAVALRL